MDHKKQISMIKKIGEKYQLSKQSNICARNSIPYFEQLFSNLKIPKSTFDQMLKTMNFVTPAGFIQGFAKRFGINTGISNIPITSSSQMEIYGKEIQANSANNFKGFNLRQLRNYIREIEQFRPIYEHLRKVGKKAGLRVVMNASFHNIGHEMPSITFYDSQGEVFWINARSNGKEILIKHIQGLNPNNAKGNRERVHAALDKLKYPALKDSLFNEVCKAAKKSHVSVHYMHPSKDPFFRGSHASFHSFTKRQKLKVTKTRATRHLKKRK
jgi:hypothetical protein